MDPNAETPDHYVGWEGIGRQAILHCEGTGRERGCVCTDMASYIRSLSAEVSRHRDKYHEATVEIEQLTNIRNEAHRAMLLLAGGLTALKLDINRPDTYQVRCDTALKLLHDAFETTKDSPRYVGVDLAKPGSDRTAFRCLHCGHVSDDPSMTHQCLPEQDND